MNLQSQNVQYAPSVIAGEFSQIVNLRERVARFFSAEIAAATPQVCAALHERLTQSADAEEQKLSRFVSRVLARRQDQMAATIIESMCRRFDAKLDCPADALSHTGQFSIEALSMMEELGMQEEFELEQRVNVLRTQCQSALHCMNLRLCELLGSDFLPESHNPLFVRVMLRSLQDALGAIGFDVRTRRLAFRAYGPLLTTIMPSVYSCAIAVLAGEESIATAEFSEHCNTSNGRHLNAWLPPAGSE